MNDLKSIDDVVALNAGYRARIDYDHEHRCAEHEHEHEHEHEFRPRKRKNLRSEVPLVLTCRDRAAIRGWGSASR